MAAHNPGIVSRYAVQFSVKGLVARFAELGLVLRPASGFQWNARRSAVVLAGGEAPVIRALPSGDAFELRLMTWGIPPRRQPHSTPLFNFQPGTQEFALSARLMAPLIPLDADVAGGGTLVMAAGIERDGAWTMLVRPAAKAGLEAALMTDPETWRAWLQTGRLSGP